MNKLETRTIHAGSHRPGIEAALVTPIFQTATYEYAGQGYHDVGYIRLSNSPNHELLARRIASLEHAEAALVTGSGMAAISTTLLSLLSRGDHLLVQDCLYGGTTGLLNDELSRLGITHMAIDVQDPSTWDPAFTQRTKAIYVETLTNPLLQLADLEAVVEFARSHRILSVIDNTFASPINFLPIDHGFDIVLEACTKYINGHDDLAAGCVAGSAEMIRKVKLTLDHLGGILDPHGCFLLERGIKTLALRVKYQNEAALRIAEFLSKHPAIRRVNYPGLPDHPQHARAVHLLDGFGGTMSFELAAGVDAAERFLRALTIPIIAPSLGGIHSLLIRPAAVTHSNLSREQLSRMGISDSLVRLSVGLEATEDLIEDIRRALDSLA